MNIGCGRDKLWGLHKHVKVELTIMLDTVEHN
jgi:hypothetical protein